MYYFIHFFTYLSTNFRSFELESDIDAPIFIEKFEKESLIADPTFLLRSKLHGVEDVPNQISGQNSFFHTDEF